MCTLDIHMDLHAFARTHTTKIAWVQHRYCVYILYGVECTSSLCCSIHTKNSSILTQQLAKQCVCAQWIHKLFDFLKRLFYSVIYFRGNKMNECFFSKNEFPLKIAKRMLDVEIFFGGIFGKCVFLAMILHKRTQRAAPQLSFEKYCCHCISRTSTYRQLTNVILLLSFR